MKHPRAEFLISLSAGGKVPAGDLPVVALVGRSNVGKSRLINALAESRIARAGAKPGTTRLVNVYRLSTAPPQARSIIIADLPGYGYARGGHRTRRDFDDLTRGFFDQVEVPPSAPDAVRLAAVVLVVDIRHPGLASDIDARRWALDGGYPLLTVVTKSDRVSRTAGARLVLEHAASLGTAVVPVSAKTGAGIPKVWAGLRALLY